MMEDIGTEPISGQYPVTLDDKGRLMFPARLRATLPEPSVVITRGIDKCLWIFTKDQWQAFEESILRLAAGNAKQSLLLQRLLLSPAQEVPCDKNGRIGIPQRLRTLSALTKDGLVFKGCYGKIQLMELWDTASYDEFVSRSEGDLADIMGNLSDFGS